MGRGLLCALAVAAASLALTAPAYGGPAVYGLTTANALVRFDSADLSTLEQVTPIVGMQANENAVAIAWPYDFERPQTLDGNLFVLTDQSRLYRVDPGTGITWSQGPPLRQKVKASYFGMSTEGSTSPDYLVAWNDAGRTLGIAPARGMPPDDPGPFGTPSPGGLAHDLPLSYVSGDVAAGQKPSLVGVALSFRPPAMGYNDDWTFGIDAQRGTLVRAKRMQGQLETVGPLGVPVGRRSGFALAVHGPGPGPALFATAPEGTNASRIYHVNLDTGEATQLGTLPEGVVLRGLAYAPPPTIRVHGSNWYLLDSGLPAHVRQVERHGDPLPAVTVRWTLGCGFYGCPSDSTPAPAQDGVIAFAPLQTLAPYVIRTQRTGPAWFEVNFVLGDTTGGAVLGEISRVTYTLTDLQPKLDLPAPIVHSSDGVAAVTVTRPDSGANQAANVTYATAGGTAVPGRDYKRVTGSLKLAAGQTTKTFELQLAAGKSDGKSRTVGLRLRSAGGRARDTASLAIVADPKLRVKLDVRHREGGRLPVVVSCNAACEGQVKLKAASGELDRRKLSIARGKRKVVRLHVGSAASGTVKVTVHDGLGRRAHATRAANLR